jgi:hypothetical protein
LRAAAFIAVRVAGNFADHFRFSPALKYDRGAAPSRAAAMTHPTPASHRAP